MKVEIDGVKVEITFDADDRPTVAIDVKGERSDGNPVVDVLVNETLVHNMYADNDGRWPKPAEFPKTDSASIMEHAKKLAADWRALGRTREEIAIEFGRVLGTVHQPPPP